MVETKVVIPVALQIVADDYGWHNGRDGRQKGRPSRSGLPRNHAPEDYTIINEIGRAVDQKIVMPIVLGEWDKDNYLRGLKHATYDEAGWDRAAEINMRVAEQCFEAAESSDYVEYAYHGLLHGYYVDGKQIAETEYSRPIYDAETDTYMMKKHAFIPLDEMQTYMETFFRIYDSWGFKKKIRTFVSPSSPRTSADEVRDFVKVLKQNGMTLWANKWGRVKGNTTVIDGLTFVQKEEVGASWEQYDVDPMMLVDQCSRAYYNGNRGISPILAFHWTNFLRLEPLNNMERLGDWVKYLKRQNTIYGQMLSRDIGFAASQVVYSRFAEVSIEDKKCIVDLAGVDEQGSLALTDTFYISTKCKINPRTCMGGEMTLYEEFDTHKTWKITRTNMSKRITFDLV